jgi:hypothetical protein
MRLIAGAAILLIALVLGALTPAQAQRNFVIPADLTFPLPVPPPAQVTTTTNTTTTTSATTTTTATTDPASGHDASSGGGRAITPLAGYVMGSVACVAV